MKKIAVTTHYDTNNSVSYVVPYKHKGLYCISIATYNKLLAKRKTGGGLKFDSNEDIYVHDKKWNTIDRLHEAPRFL